MRLVAGVLLGLLSSGAGLVSAEDAKLPEAPEITLNELTVQYTLLFQTKKYPEAVQAATRALNVAEEAFGASDPRVAQVLNDVGRLYQAQGQDAAAEPFHRRALDIRERLLSPAATVQSLTNLARVYQAEGRDADAEPLLTRALGMLEQHAGKDHPQAARVLVFLAQGDSRQGKTTEAEPLFARALAMVEPNPHGWELDSALIMTQYAACLRKNGKIHEAEAAEAHAAALRTKSDVQPPP